jgi:hypothetical protein
MTEYKQKKLQFKSELNAFLDNNRGRININSKRLCHFFELACYCRVLRYYQQQGFTLTILPEKNRKVFRFKATTQGTPNKYSFFRIYRESTQVPAENRIYDIRSNMPVCSANNDGKYTPDIVISYHSDEPDIEKIVNGDLISFCEVKYLKAHPEMLANFIGMVYEIIPECILGPEPDADQCIHPAPSLIVYGGSSGNVERIRAGMMGRYRINFALDYENNDAGQVPIRKIPDRV